MTDMFGMVDGSILQTHDEHACQGEACCVHHPSSHPLSTARLKWRGDRGLMERICPHGVGHPDPDDLAFKRRTMGSYWYDQGAWGVHGCDGCCREDS